MKPLHLALLGIAGFGIYRYGSLAVQGSRISTEVQGFRVKSISLTGLSIELDLLVRNPTSQSVALDYLTLDMSANGTKFGTVGANDFKALRAKNPDYFSIPSNTNKVVTVGCKLSSAGTLRVLAGWLTGGSVPKSVKLDGVAKVEGFTVVISQTEPLNV